MGHCRTAMGQQLVIRRYRRAVHKFAQELRRRVLHKGEQALRKIGLEHRRNSLVLHKEHHMSPGEHRSRHRAHQRLRQQIGSQEEGWSE